MFIIQDPNSGIGSLPSATYGRDLSRAGNIHAAEDATASSHPFAVNATVRFAGRGRRQEKIHPTGSQALLALPKRHGHLAQPVE